MLEANDEANTQNASSQSPKFSQSSGSGSNENERQVEQNQRPNETMEQNCSLASESSSTARPSSAAATALGNGGQKSTSRTSLMSDTTTLSVCSLSSAATSTATAAHSLSGKRLPPRPTGYLKKSSSSLSSSATAAASARRSSTRAPPAAPGQLSFSGIRRPGASGSRSSSTATLAATGGHHDNSSNPNSKQVSLAAAAKTKNSQNTTTRISIGQSKPTTVTTTTSKTTGPSFGAQSTNLITVASNSSSRGPTLAMSLRDKDQQIKLLIKERDERRAQAELMAQKADEWREKFEASELERSHMTSEADDEVVELRRLAQEFEDENKRLASKLVEREQQQGELEFKLNELECERQELASELELKENQLLELESDRRDLLEGHRSGPELITERTMSKAKYEREIEELKERITCRDEQLIQLRSSLEMRKNEVVNLQAHASDLERKLKIESERSERHLKRIDEINLELKTAEDKLATKSEENEIQEKQVRQLRHELRQTEEKLEQISLARKKDVDILHNKLAAARRGSTTPTGGPNQPCSPQPNFKTPTPQDEIVRLQMEIRDLKDQLIDREAELDCNRRDLEVIKRKMETRTLEVDCNNQELARRCQDLLEQNRQSEDTIKQLLKSTTEHSASLMRATEELKEANGKCVKLREEISELELKLEEQLRKFNELARENTKLRDDNEEQREQIDLLRDQIQSLNDQIGDLCLQLNLQTNNLHRDREALADELSKQEIERAQLAHDLATAKQDLRTQKLHQQEVENERSRLKSNLELKEKYIKSREELLTTMRSELEECQKSLGDYKQKLEQVRSASETELTSRQRELKQQVDQLRHELRIKSDECQTLADQCSKLELKCRQLEESAELEVDEKFDEMRRKHSAELDELLLRIKSLESAELQPEQRVRLNDGSQTADEHGQVEDSESEQTNESRVQDDNKMSREEYETQIGFLNSLVVDMQRKCDDYKNRLALFESSNLINELDKMLSSSSPLASQSEELNGNQKYEQATNQLPSRSSTLKRVNGTSHHNANKLQDNSSATLTRQRVVRIQDPLDELLDGVERAQRQTRHISGRPYCDLCQIYDRHHTVYCPRVNEKLNYHSSYDNNDMEHHETNNNNNNNNHLNRSNVDEMFREYEESLRGNSKLVAPAQFASLRRPSAAMASQRD